jgi:predicted small lipoprotein YifL
MYHRRKWMNKKLHVASLVILAVLFLSMAGCAKKTVRHLASDVCLVTPDQTTKEQVLTYLGPPDEQYEMAEGGETWIYYDVRKDMLRGTPYIGDKIGEQKYEMVTVKFGGDIVQTCVYRLLTEEEFQEGGLAK